jgi:hypothetical protein
MSDTPSPTLLSEERLAEIRALSKLEQAAPRGTSKHTYGLAPRAADAVPELLAHIAACRQQVAAELASFLVNEQRYAPGDSELAQHLRKSARAYNEKLRAAATRLQIDLTAPTP